MTGRPLFEAITVAIDVALEADSPARDATLDTATYRLCVEVRRLEMLPEEMIVFVKQSWTAHPGVSAMPTRTTRRVLDDVISRCIVEYFRTCLHP